MFKEKIKIIAAISISCCLFVSHVVLAADDTLQLESSKTSQSQSEQITTENKNKIEPKISIEEAKKIVKAFKFTEGYEISNIYLEGNDAGTQPIYRVDLLGRDNSDMIISISANSGELINFNLWQSLSKVKNIVTITKKQAQEYADKFIKENVAVNGKSIELVPDTVDMYYEKMNGIYDTPQYQFTYALKVNGILVNNFIYNITVNAANGKITNFYSPNPYLIETNYPSLDGIKDLSTLKSKYGESLQMQLQYISIYEGNTLKQSLVYIPVMPGVLNAKTLEVTRPPYYYNYTRELKNKPLVADFKVVNQKISDEEAQKTAENIKSYIEKLVGIKFNNNSGNSVYVSSLANSDSTRSYYYTSNDKINYGLSIQINLSTGNINGLSFYQYEIDGQTQQKVVNEKVSYYEAKKTGEDILKNIFARQYGVYSDNNKEFQEAIKDLEEQAAHQLVYQRFENNIMTNDSININIDKETGKPTQIYLSWSDMEYPKPKHIISAEQAKEIYMKSSEFVLSYYTPYDYKSDTIIKTGDTIIIYSPDNLSSFGYLDAEKGVMVDYNGKEIKKTSSNETHWAAANIEMLKAQGIVLSNITNYDDKLTRQDAVKMLSLVFGYQYSDYRDKTESKFPDVPHDNEYFRYVESAVGNKIIEATGKNFNGKQNITKQEFINMLINVMGYQEIIKHPDLFAKKDGDLKITFCSELDILPVKPGETFNAKDEITFAEAAYSLQKALKYIR